MSLRFRKKSLKVARVGSDMEKGSLLYGLLQAETEYECPGVNYNYW